MIKKTAFALLMVFFFLSCEQPTNEIKEVTTIVHEGSSAWIWLCIKKNINFYYSCQVLPGFLPRKDAKTPRLGRILRVPRPPIQYTGEYFDEGFRVDLFIEGKVIIELKSEEKITPVHKKQLLTYLKLTKTKLGFILNLGQQ